MTFLIGQEAIIETQVKHLRISPHVYLKSRGGPATQDPELNTQKSKKDVKRAYTVKLHLVLGD